MNDGGRFAEEKEEGKEEEQEVSGGSKRSWNKLGFTCMYIQGPHRGTVRFSVVLLWFMVNSPCKL